jgi:hypothetical protein
MRRFVIAGIVVGFLGFAAEARAWNPHGHRVVAAAAYPKLQPQVRQKVASLLALHPQYHDWVAGVSQQERELAAFMRASNWADDIRDMPGFPEGQKHKDWHYTNVPFSSDGTPTRPPAVPNVKTQLAAMRKQLANRSASDHDRAFALVWLLHLVGDVHMPLHCTARFDRKLPGGDRGGTLILVSTDPTDNLHLFWDRALGTSTQLVEARAAARALPAVDAALAAVADENVWVTEGFEAAKKWVYRPPVGVGPGPFPLDARYAQEARTVAAQRMALAGERLARLLNHALE